MFYTALYRRYRPTDFEGIIGQEPTVRTLINQIKSGRIGHAYLFTGTRGVGKTTLARIFAKAINCEANREGSPCGKCRSCIALDSPNIDVIEMDGASNNRVDEARELKENAVYPPAVVRYKVYIIDEVHMLTGSAFNALLKIIEEPPAHVVFILCTTEAHKIPATILSRVMRFDLRLVSSGAIYNHLKEILDKIGKKYEDEAVGLIARASRGSVRDSLTMTDSVLNSSEILTRETVSDSLGITDFDTLQSISKSIIEGNTADMMREIGRALDMGKSSTLLARDLSLHFRDLYLVKISGAKTLHVSADTAAQLEGVAANASVKKILLCAETFSKIEGELRYSSVPAIIFETAAFRAAISGGEIDLDALSLKIANLEKQIARIEGELDAKKKP